MNGFWKTWLNIWCLGVGLFGLVLAGGAFAATSGPVERLLEIFDEYWIPGTIVLVCGALLYQWRRRSHLVYSMS